MKFLKNKLVNWIVTVIQPLVVRDLANMHGVDVEQLSYKIDSYLSTLRDIELRVQQIDVTLKTLGKKL